MAGEKPENRNICIGCQNRHGCLTKEPFCLLLEREESERDLLGKELMKSRGLLKDCRDCPHFRLCWTEEAYRKALLTG